MPVFLLHIRLLFDISLGCGGVTIGNGQVTFPDGTDYNAQATYTCNDGYDLVGLGQITCLDTGIWDLGAAACTIKGKPIPLPNPLLQKLNACNKCECVFI